MRRHALLEGIASGAHAYFVHSYQFKPILPDRFEAALHLLSASDDRCPDRRSVRRTLAVASRADQTGCDDW